MTILIFFPTFTQYFSTLIGFVIIPHAENNEAGTLVYERPRPLPVCARGALALYEGLPVQGWFFLVSLIFRNKSKHLPYTASHSLLST